MYSANQRSALPPTWCDMWARFAGGARARPIGGHRARGERGEWPELIAAALSLHCSTVAPRMCRAKNRRRRRLRLEPNTLCLSTQRPSLDAVGGASCALLPPRLRNECDVVRSCAAMCLAEPPISFDRRPPGSLARAAAGCAAASPCSAGGPQMRPGRNPPVCFFTCVSVCRISDSARREEPQVVMTVVAYRSGEAPPRLTAVRRVRRAGRSAS